MKGRIKNIYRDTVASLEQLQNVRTQLSLANEASGSPLQQAFARSATPPAPSCRNSQKEIRQRGHGRPLIQWRSFRRLGGRLGVADRTGPS